MHIRKVGVSNPRHMHAIPQQCRKDEQNVKFMSSYLLDDTPQPGCDLASRGHLIRAEGIARNAECSQVATAHDTIDANT